MCVLIQQCTVCVFPYSAVEAIHKVASNVVLSYPLLCRPQACSGGPLHQHSEGKGAEEKVREAAVMPCKVHSSPTTVLVTAAN